MLNRLSLLLFLCLAATLTWADAPTITTITPASALAGTVITITGTDLDKVTAVTFNGTTAKTITDATATSLKVTVPEGATTGKLAVTNADGTTPSTDNFIVYSGLKTNARDNATMVWVPGGTFTMGSAADIGEKRVQPAHQVTLSGYWIYQNDVTVAQFRAFCTANGRKMPEWPGKEWSWKGKTGWNDPTIQQHPIVNVNWNDAKAYADWAGVRLPTEAQWEYAACGPQENNYPWGGTAKKDDDRNGWNEAMCANYYNSFKFDKSTWPVGSFPAGASWCGALDMAGNVWQWCSDWYGVYKATAVSDPVGPANGTELVLRGGSWNNYGDYYTYCCTNRSSNSPAFFSNGIGFRCVSLKPTVTTIAPLNAVAGTVVTITGTYLDRVTAVTFNGVAAKNIIDNTETTLKVAVPEGATSGKLAVTTAGGTVTSSSDYVVFFGQKTNAKDNASLLWVPGATFTMGSAADVGEANEHPAHPVTLSGYWIYQHDITVAQYRAFCTATKHKLPKFPRPTVDFPTIDKTNLSWAAFTTWSAPALQQHPIVNVTWNDAKAYADWAGVTLPTEAQWEYAARGPQGRNYPWGGTATKDDRTNGWDATRCANSENSLKVEKSTWPVGSFPTGASWCGAQDMAGNVFQWCADWYGDYAATPATDPAGPATGKYRTLRGGSWYSPATGNRSAGRSKDYLPTDFSYYIGFRCASLTPGP